MRFPHHSRMSIIRRGEKELRLNAFIARGLDSVASAAQMTGGQTRQRALLAIARSAQSPVIKAVGTLSADIAAAGYGVRILLARTEPSRHVDALAELQATLCEVRIARNPRLIEAHEQLVVGGRICWTGDAMRRDPAIHDAYESFVEDCPEIAAAAAATFERLWVDGEPLASALPMTPAASTPKAINPPAHLARRT